MLAQISERMWSAHARVASHALIAALYVMMSVLECPQDKESLGQWMKLDVSTLDKPIATEEQQSAGSFPSTTTGKSCDDLTAVAD